MYGGGGGPYGNTSNDRIKDTLAKAQSMLLDDPFTVKTGGMDHQVTGSFGGQPLISVPTAGIYGGGFNAGSGLGIPPLAKAQSTFPTYGGSGIQRSQYTNSEGESEFDNHSNMGGGRRRQWGGAVETNFGNDAGDDHHFKSGGASSNVGGLNLGGLNDLAGVTDIPTLDLG